MRHAGVDLVLAVVDEVALGVSLGDAHFEWLKVQGISESPHFLLVGEG